MSFSYLISSDLASNSLKICTLSNLPKTRLAHGSQYQTCLLFKKSDHSNTVASNTEHWRVSCSQFHHSISPRSEGTCLVYQHWSAMSFYGNPRQLRRTQTTSSTSCSLRPESHLVSSNLCQVLLLRSSRKPSPAPTLLLCTSPGAPLFSKSFGKILLPTWTSTRDTRGS